MKLGVVGNAICLLALTVSTQALQCMTCDGAHSHEECDRTGKIVTCLDNEEKCALEERKLDSGRHLLVFKSCKQAHACNNNFIQNDRPAWWPVQCNPDHPNAVCRCCCDTDSCNLGPQKCKKMPLKNGVRLCQPDLVAPNNSEMICTNGSHIGSICSFSCIDGYFLVGRKISVCDSSAAWSSPVPICSPIRCHPPLTSVQDGFMICDNGNELDSTCRFFCDEGYRLLGNQSSVCELQEDLISAAWSHEQPTCKPIACPDQGLLKNGEIVCNRDNFYDSQCKFECKNDQYIHHPPELTSNVCLLNGSWSQPKPCCIKPCPPFAVFDLVMALDSSSSVGFEGWKMTLDFVKSFANLYDLNVLNFALFRYNSRVDSKSEIRFDSGLEPPRLLDEIGHIPYDGTGTSTGEALTYAGEVMLSMARGRRRGAQAVVIVVTDGKSQDDVIGPAQMLRSRGIKTFAVGVIPLDGELDFDELREIAGDPERVAIADGFVNLDEDFAKQLSKDVCGDPCDQLDLDDL